MSHQFIYKISDVQDCWVPYNGAVPRVGEEVKFMDRGDGETFIVARVLWYIGNGSHNEARIWLEPKPPEAREDE